MNFSSCTDNVVTTNQNQTQIAQARFIHASPSIGLVDFTVLDLNSQYFNDVFPNATDFEKSFGYANFTPAMRTFKVYLTKTTTGIAVTSFTMINQQKYSIILLDTAASIDGNLLWTQDTTALPTSGIAFVRFVNASADAPAMNIFGADTTKPLISNFTRRQVSPYFTMPAATIIPFRAIQTSLPNVTWNLGTMNFQSGMNYTVVFLGSVTGLPGVPLSTVPYMETSL